jgi:hypothetical protein
LVTERVRHTPGLPTVRVGDPSYQRRPGGNRAFKARIRSVHNDDHPN